MSARWDENGKYWSVGFYHGNLTYTPHKEKGNIWLHAEAHDYNNNSDDAQKTMKRCLEEIGVGGDIVDCYKDSVYWYATFREKSGEMNVSFISVADVKELWRKYAVKNGHYVDARVYFEDYVQCWTADGIKLGNTIGEAYALLKSETAK